MSDRQKKKKTVAFLRLLCYKDMFTDANQPFLYEHVENGTWTLGKQISPVPLFHRDNGNNAQDKSGDVYGFVRQEIPGEAGDGAG